MVLSRYFRLFFRGFALLTLLLAPPAFADRPFEDCDLFSGHSVRQSSKDRKVAVGADMLFAPVSYAEQKIDAVTGKASAKKSASAYGIDPWFEYNFGTYDLTTHIPVAGFAGSGMSQFDLGNIDFDFRVGSRHGYTFAWAWTAGMSLYLPTGGTKANDVALGNAIAAPKYLHEYLSFQPYGMLGGQIGILRFMARLEYTHMQRVRDSITAGQPGKIGYANWGLSTVWNLYLIDLVGELDGLVNVYDAQAFQDIFATAGIRFPWRNVRFGAGVRMPLTTNSNTDYAKSLGSQLGVGNLAKATVLGQVILSF